MKYILTAALFLSSSVLWAQIANWQLNDVSTLFPLPKASDSENFLLKASDKGPAGELFPRSQEDAISSLIISYDRPDDVYESIRAVGMRIDPCFKFTNLPIEKCNPQIRLVWQPVGKIGTDAVTTYDGAIHTFYALTQSEFSYIKNEIQKIKRKNLDYKIRTEGKPLSVHPAFLNTARRASFNQEIKNLILKFAGEKRLVRFTFMRLLTTDLWWEFGGRDLSPAGVWGHTVIPKLASDQEKQEFFNEAAFEPTSLRGTILPNVNVPLDNLEHLIPGYGVRDDQAGRAIVQEGIVSINRIENPNIHHPATLDCVHCHITDPAKIWMEKEKPELLKKAQNSKFAYVQDFIGRHNLRNVTNDKSHNKSLRAFGYYKNKPSVNQRAINESAAVADFLNKSF